jgi:hypothetical protein
MMDANAASGISIHHFPFSLTLMNVHIPAHDRESRDEIFSNMFFAVAS